MVVRISVQENNFAQQAMLFMRRCVEVGVLHAARVLVHHTIRPHSLVVNQ